MSGPTILTFVGHYLPGYKAGGPIRTIANMVDRMHASYAFRIVTADRDHHDDQPYLGVVADEWSSVGNAEVYYASRRTQNVWGFRRLIRETPHDVMYLNSLFSPRFTLLPLLLRLLGAIPSQPTVLAPRGELGSGALALKSQKKQVFLKAAKWVGLYRGLYWQASSDHEARRIADVMGVARDHIFVAPDLPSRLQERSARERESCDGQLTVMYLSRIAPMKNLRFALRVLSQVNTPVNFVIYGTLEDVAYWADCQSLMAEIPNHVHVEYRGEISHDQVQGALASADLFFLPTRGENYGHAIVEALSAGLPVLISDKTPWSDVQDCGAGWALPLEDPAAFARAIDGFAGDSPERRAIRANSAYKYGRAVAEATDAIHANTEMFERVIASNA